MLLRLLKQLPVQLCASIFAAFVLGEFASLAQVSLAYTISSCFIEILMFVLPAIVFSFILRALANIEGGSFSLLMTIFLGVTISNCLAILVAYFFGYTFLPDVGMSHSVDFAERFSSSVDVIFRLDLPNIIQTEIALVIGIVCGLFVNFLKDTSHFKKRVQAMSLFLSDSISNLLSKIFIPLLPLYVFGFCLKLSYDDALVHLFEQYGKIFLISMVLVILYISMLYLIGAGFKFSQAYKYIKAMLPAGLTGFSTMSSAATMPVTLECTEAVTKDRNYTDLVIPSTANIHMLGDDLTIVLTSLTLLTVFGKPWPDIMIILPFALAFSVAKLSCVGIPGASVFVVLPVLQSYLGFSPEMLSVLTTIYVLQDPFGTAANVMGNGAFALIIQRVRSIFKGKDIHKGGV